MLVYRTEEDFDVSAHVVGFLVMLTSSPHYRLVEPARETVQNEIESVIKLWDIDMQKGVKFRLVKFH